VGWSAGVGLAAAGVTERGGVTGTGTDTGAVGGVGSIERITFSVKTWSGAGCSAARSERWFFESDASGVTGAEKE